MVSDQNPESEGINAKMIDNDGDIPKFENDDPSDKEATVMMPTQNKDRSYDRFLVTLHDEFQAKCFCSRI